MCILSDNNNNIIVLSYGHEYEMLVVGTYCLVVHVYEGNDCY